MKKILVTLMSLLLLVSVTQAEPLPGSSYYNGQYSEFFDLGSEGTLDLRLEFSVYRSIDEVELGDGTITSEAQLMKDYTGYSGDADYVYGYQVFSETSSTAALTYFALTGVNPSTIADVQNDIGEAESLNNGAIQSEGIEPTSSDFNASVTEAIWKFEDGALVQGDQSWFLFLYSDYDWTAGGIEVQQANDDIPVPEVPEPATLALLACGTILSLKRRK
jgi:hypothetical protein